MNPDAPRRLHPASLITRIVSQLRQSILALLPIGGSFAFAERPFVSVPVALAIVGAIILFPVLGWLRFRYAIGDDALAIDSGVLSRNRRVIPFERVQDIDVERGLIARATGTALVKVETGSSGEDEGKLDVVTLAEAERLRTAIRAWRAGSDAVVALVDAPPPERLLFTMPLGRVLLSGLLGFSLVYIAGLFVVFEWVQPFIEGTRYDLGDRFGDRIGDAAERWKGERPTPGSLLRGAPIAAVGGLIGAAVALGLVTGVVLSLLRDYGFRLTETAAGFRVRRGLVTLKETQVPRARVQRALLRAGPVARLLGLTRVELGTLGGAEAKGGSYAVAPLATPEEAAAILAEVGLDPAPPTGAWRRGHGLMVLARALPPGVGVVAATVVIAVLFAPLLPLLLALLPVAALAWLSWRGERHALVDGVLHVRTGILGRRHAIVPLRRVQSVSVRRGPFERLLGLATVVADVAGGSGAPAVVSGLVPQDARALAVALLAGRRAFLPPSRLRERSGVGGPRSEPERQAHPQPLPQAGGELL